MIKKIGSYFTTAYLLLMFTIYPLYMRLNYATIGKDKYQFFFLCSISAVGILAVMKLIQVITQAYRYTKAGIPYAINWEKVSATDIFVMMYAVVNFLSFTVSDYKQEAWLGTKGWYMGLATQLLLCALYYFVSRMWDGERIVAVLAIISSGLVCLLMIMDRLSIHILPLANRSESFLATIGNINWICGYLSVTMPIGLCIFLFTSKKWIQYLTGLYAFLAFCAAFAQGASSIFLFFAGIFALLLWITVSKNKWLHNWLILAMLWCLATQIVRILRKVFLQGFQYDTDNLCGYLTNSNLTIWIGILLLLIDVVFFFQKIEMQEKTWRRILLIVISVCAGGYLIILTINTIIGIPGLAANQNFLFSDSWGNGRGATIKAGLWIFKDLPFTNKILGVGPDCFSAGAYQVPEISQYLHSFFGSSRLTNAHFELLTCLDNIGIAGALIFLGMFFSIFIRCMKNGKEKPQLLMIATCIFGYMVHNLISFAQVMNFPIVILLIAMGEKLLTNSKNIPTIEVQSKE